MTKKSNIEVAYEFLKQQNDASKFDAIWKAVEENIGEQKKDKNSLVAELYSDLVLDTRFSLTPEGTWALRENLKFQDVKKQYDYIDAIGKPKKAKITEEAEEDIVEIEDEDINDDDDDELFEDDDEDDE